MKHLVPVLAGILLLALLAPAAALADHPCCHPGRPGGTCSPFPFPDDSCRDTGLAGACQCRLAPSPAELLPAVDAPEAPAPVPATPLPGAPASLPARLGMEPPARDLRAPAPPSWLTGGPFLS